MTQPYGQPAIGRRRLGLMALSLCLGGAATPSRGHDFRAGSVVIDHPYAVPSATGATTGAAYLRGLRNRGDEPDRLLGASTTAAARVELHQMTMDGDVMRMRQVDAIDLPPRAEVSLRHGGRYHLMLVDLKRPLKDGDRFDLTLRFERAGSRTVQVWVQTPRDMKPHQH